VTCPTGFPRSWSPELFHGSSISQWFRGLLAAKNSRAASKKWRFRVGSHRIVYEIDDAARTVDVTRIAHRREVYG